ncbi:glycoside hydrolase family 75 protein [Clostridium sp. DJ247]|uniref:glycoside hydrolase family 75 protein n=1 Tax=Clostridium sp. DJ247 TaxID=2726188 RepID=UPI001629B312|nr:glycoside hydrolase family 75 protein [Clostridium sp. DJ247]MBC2579700.1 ligand-binding protein SH3 [Clostridium sp. DJ247]
MIYTVQPDDSLCPITKNYNSTASNADQILDTTSRVEYLRPQQTIPAPQETKPDPGPTPWPHFEENKKGTQFAVFKEKDIKKDIVIYNCRSSFFFMSKMAVEKTGCFSICEHAGTQCGRCFTSESLPFYVIPWNTNWVGLGDYGVVINTRTKKAAYAICADWGPKQNTTLISGNTLFAGKIGEGSIYLGKHLNIKDISPTPHKAFEPYNILYIIFPNSSNGVTTIKNVEQVNKDAHRYFKKWGGWPQAQYVLKENYGIILQ